ncbi:hypothetical protein GCM10027072_15310 [Streptomyces bullii]
MYLGSLTPVPETRAEVRALTTLIQYDAALAAARRAKLAERLGGGRMHGGAGRGGAGAVRSAGAARSGITRGDAETPGYPTEGVGYRGETAPMTVNWAAFATAEPDLAKTVEERFGAYTHHVLATLRKDGSPRTTGLEVRFLNGELWLGMMPNSLKALDLLRDPRFALQANPGEGTGMGGGDVRISGRAIEVHDPETTARYV